MSSAAVYRQEGDTVTMPNTGVRVLAVIRGFILEHGYSPTVREIADEAALSSTSVAWYWMGKLRDAGLIKWAPGHTRTVRLTGIDDDPDVAHSVAGRRGQDGP